MRILIASDKFKGSLTAVEANTAIAEGIRKGTEQEPDITSIPIADGGDGLVATLVAATGGTTESLEVTGPLGAPTNATIGFLPDNETTVIEMAEASGIALIPADQLNPQLASTFGTGEMIRHLISRGCKKIIMGIGGSATNDGGTGMARALGFQFLDSQSRPVENLPADLLEVTTMIAPDDLALPEILIACDVTNPLLGPDGCTRIYGPQKGITPDQFEDHESKLSHLVSLCGEKGRNAAPLPGAGAAGGLGFGSIVFLGADLTPGFDLVSELLNLEAAVQSADLVITGEGSLDAQSLLGKGPGSLARLAREYGKEVIAVCGRSDDLGESKLFDKIIEIGDPALTLKENMDRAFELLAAKSEDFARKSLSKP
ncbi:MAG: glycerate kinase [Verrucomicrobiales bacterium]|nr:glycerate kinase [Verrucomicrobiales bacterium]